jgi:hypothetical protein
MNFKKYIHLALYLIAAMGVSSTMAGSYDDFFRAVDIDNAGMVVSLAQRGFDVNSRNPQGQTGLFLALRGGSFKVADVLLKVPTIDVNALNEAGESALMMAALRGLPDWSRRLLERGAQINKEGWSPLHYAATGPDATVVQLLIDRGAAIEALSPNRTTPLMMAARYGKDASVDVLLAAGADPRRKNDLGMNAADFARSIHRDALAAKLDQLTR